MVLVECPDEGIRWSNRTKLTWLVDWSSMVGVVNTVDVWSDRTNWICLFSMDLGFRI